MKPWSYNILSSCHFPFNLAWLKNVGVHFAGNPLRAEKLAYTENLIKHTKEPPLFRASDH